MSSGRLNPNAPIPGSVGRQTLGDFWAWAFSNILTNNLRGIFAEFLVGTALGALEAGRTKWDAVDLLYEGAGIEVKSSAYLQSWNQENRLSTISWNIAEHYSFDPETNDWTEEKGRGEVLRAVPLHRGGGPEPGQGARLGQVGVLRRAHGGYLQ